MHSAEVANWLDREAAQTDVNGPPIDLAHYSAALDEIYRLRCALAYEARILEVHLGYATFPKSRRAITEEQAERMRAAARGHARTAYAELAGKGQEFLQAIGAPTTLTRSAWEEMSHG